MKFGGLSDHSHGVNAHILSNEKVYTEGIDCFSKYFLLSETKSNFITYAM